MPTFLPVIDNNRPFQPVFQPCINETLQHLGVLFKDTLHSVYLAGSVARRDAVPGQSDLNLTLVFERPLNDLEKSRLHSLSTHIARRYRAVKRLDIRLAITRDVLSLDGIFQWGFWLRHCCVCLKGDDLSGRFGAFEPSWDAAKSLNGPFEPILIEYREKILKTRVPEHYLDYCEYIGKKMLWTAYTLVFHREKVLALSVREATDLFLNNYPDKAVDVERAYILMSRTQVPKKASLFLMQGFGQWLVDEWNKIERKIG
ncbi:nucleotidyltransferase domain-containing protein [Photobacterium sp. WH24]|uniref:nucleotidyltransferase domain-containing protein n=1 Tax=Photobacterium sp. WH24 TaxID=2827237 RepID=UPI001C43F756|nr:nucleotidyltransferase domain-containing protein [Photobacterium sp. WH24]MBV7262439.1 nucleotidyltransferase domain-containing protein [Photobacterium sp. WH24]